MRATASDARAGADPGGKHVDELPVRRSGGDSFGNSLAQSIIGLFKTEVIKFLGPWRSMAQVEWETLQWVRCYNNERPHSAIGHRPPQEVKETFYEQINSREKAA